MWELRAVAILFNYPASTFLTEIYTECSVRITSLLPLIIRFLITLRIGSDPNMDVNRMFTSQNGSTLFIKTALT